MKITDDQLKDLRDNAFGDCTTVCECMDLKDLREELERDGGDLTKFVKGLLEREGVWWDRCHDVQGHGGIEVDHNEHNEWMAGVKKRVLSWLKENG